MAANYKVGVSVDAQGVSKAASELQKVDKALNNVGTSVRDIIGGNLAADALKGIASLAYDGAKAVFDFSSRMEQTKIGFETLMGGAQSASQHLLELQKFAAETPFEFEGLTQASRRLQNVGVAAADVIPLMRDIGNAAAAAGASSEDLEGISVAFSQIIAKGKLLAEEVNQLAERGIPVWKMLSEQLKGSKADIMKLAEQGKLSSDVFLQAFQNYSRANFGEAMVRQSKTFQGAMSTINDIVMIESQKTFKPLYDEISKFGVNVAEGMQKEEPSVRGALQKLGFGLGVATGKSFREGMEAARMPQSDWARLIFESNPTTWFFRQMLSVGEAGYKGFNQGFAKQSGASNPFLAAVGLSDSLGKVLGGSLPGAANKLGTEVRKLPSVESMLKAGEAEKNTNKAREAVSKMVTDLTGQLAFFGQTSEVAATQQKLISQGVYDFDSAIAKSALSLAGQLDKLKSAQKAQDEYNDGLKSAAKYLADVRENTDFDIRFSNATELDKFDRWVQRNAGNFRELKGQIDQTRDALVSLQFTQGIRTRDAGQSGFLDSIGSQIEALRAANLPDATRQIRDLFDSLNLKGVKEEGSGIDTTAGFMADKVAGFIENIRVLEGMDVSTDKIKESLATFLKSFTVFNADRSVQVFTDDMIPTIIDRFLKLDEATRKNRAADKIKELENVFQDLGIAVGSFGSKTELEQFNKWLADPDVTKAIEEQARALGLEVEQLKELLRVQKQSKAASATRPRVVGEAQRTPTAGGYLGDGEVQRFQSNGEMMEATMTRLSEIGTAAFNDLAGAMGSLVENWVLYGEMSGENAKKAIASSLAMAASQSTVSAIMETAYGIAALTPWGAAIYGPAALHFQSAALFASIAAGTALAGRAIAGDSFKKGSGGSNEGAPDYQTTQSPQVSGLRENNQFARTNGGDVSQNRLAESVERLHEKISAMRPGDVLTAGAKEKRGFITDQVVGDLKSNGSKANDMGRALRLT